LVLVLGDCSLPGWRGRWSVRASISSPAA